jgi:hypothetical protein
MSSVTSQTFTFMPAMTRPPDSQNAMNSRASRSPRVDDLVVAAGNGQSRAFHAEVVLVGEEVRDGVVHDGLPEHRPGGGRAPVQGVRPVLDLPPPRTPLSVPLSGPAANAVTRGYHLSAMSGNRMRVLAD